MFIKQIKKCVNNIKNYIVSLVFIFLCLKAKAEFNYSALAVFYEEQQNDSPSTAYEKAVILFKGDKYARALKKILPYSEIDISDKGLKIKINLLIARILLEEQNKVIDFEDIIKKNDFIFPHKYLNRAKVLLASIKTTELGSHNETDLLTAETFFTLSRSFKFLKQIDSAEYYYNKIIDIDNITDAINNFKGKAYSNLGSIYIRKDSLDKGEFYTNKAIEIHTSLKNNLDLSIQYSNLGSIYMERNEYKNAKDFYNKGLSFLKKDSSLKAKRNKELLYDNLAWALYNLEDFTAYDYLYKSYEIRDNLKEEALTQELAQIKAENDVEKIQRAERDKRETLERKTWIIGGVGVAVSLLLLFLANLFKLRQRSLSLQLSQNELQQQRKLERLKSQTQVKILNATIDGKETERKEIAEILHDNVSALLSSASLHLQASQKQYNGSAPMELEKTRQIIAEASQKIRDLSHNLISSVLLKFGLEYAVKDLAKKFSNSSIKIYTVVDNLHRYSEAYELKIFNIIQELLNNVLKHSNASNAYIMMEEEDGKLNIIVKDDGDGFETKNKLETQKGIGLNHIKARIHIMKGYFVIESEIGKGTKATMNIPIVEKTKMVIA